MGYVEVTNTGVLGAKTAICSYQFEDGYYTDSKPTFLTLPIELRLEIYTYLLRLLDPTNVPGHSHPTNPQIHPQILSACRQTLSEAHSMLYRLNVFLAHPSLLTSFPRLRQHHSPITSASVISLIKRFKLRVRLDAGPGFEREDAKKAFSGLDDVEIEVWQASYRGAGREVLELFEDVRGVKRARVSGSTSGFEEYADWLGQSMMAPMGTAGQKYIDEMGNMSPIHVFSSR